MSHPATRFQKPQALRPGDRVSIIAPGMAFEWNDFKLGLNVLSRRYQVIFDDAISSRSRYSAGDDSRRQSELDKAFSDPEIKAIFCARAGYGTMRLLPDLNVSALPLKALIGFSDITALHAVMQCDRRVSIHGPVITQLGKVAPAIADRLFQLLESPHPPDPLVGATPLVPGVAEGRLLGGNLSVLSCLLGTPYMPPLDGAILCLEDIGERPYCLDRLWTHLRLAGVFDRINGIALCRFTGCEEKGAQFTSSEVLADLAHETALPCAIGFPIGHDNENVAVSFGTRVRLDAGAGRLEFLEGAVELHNA